jgi:diguanylate cyclase (GGDEF)-like protein
LALLDVGLPDGDGRELVDELAAAGTPTIVITGATDPHVRVECLALGAEEVFTKPLDFDALSAAVSARLRRHEATARLFRTDPLTGLPDRTLFQEALDSCRQRLAAESVPSSIALLDFDGFKEINDTHGHGWGDRVLKRVASLLQESLRADDVVVRWGGDELAVVLPATLLADAVRVLDRAAALIAAERYSHDSAPPFSVTLSIGVVELASGEDSETLIGEADRRLYAAKSAGGNGVWGQPVPEPAASSSRVEADVEVASGASLAMPPAEPNVESRIG